MVYDLSIKIINRSEFGTFFFFGWW